MWRTLERSDVLMLVADCRNPMLHIPRSLVRHILRDARKPLVLVLTKVGHATSQLRYDTPRQLSVRRAARRQPATLTCASDATDTTSA